MSYWIMQHCGGDENCEQAWFFSVVFVLVFILLNSLTFVLMKLLDKT